MPNTGSPSDRRRIGSASEKADSARAKGSGKKAAGKQAVTKKVAGKKAATRKAVTKKAAGKRPATRKAATKKSASKKSVAKRAASKKAVTRKAATKKSAGKKAATKKSAGKKAASKKAATKKSAGKKAASKKAASKKAVTKKAMTKKSAGKKAATKKPTTKRAAKHKPTTITRRVSRKRPASRSRAAKPLIGWREWVVLPEFTSTPIKAKVDSGAVTSSIHAFNLQITTGGGQTTARFGVAPKQGSHAAKTTVEHPVVGFKKVRSSNGQAELRPVIRTLAVIGDEAFEIDITLASRDAMGFRMLLGRRAVRNRFVIDPGRSFLQPPLSDGARPTDQ